MPHLFFLDLYAPYFLFSVNAVMIIQRQSIAGVLHPGWQLKSLQDQTRRQQNKYLSLFTFYRSYIRISPLKYLQRTFFKKNKLNNYIITK